MSDHAWAIQVMIKYDMRVNFSIGIIECESYHEYHREMFDADCLHDFYNALQRIVKEIE